MKLNYKANLFILFVLIVGMLIAALSLSVFAQEEEEYAMLVFVSGVPYWIDARQGFEDAASEFGVKMTFNGPTSADVAEQTAIMDQLVAKGVKGILLAPADPNALTPAINRAIKNGVTVILFDGDAPESNRLSFVGTSNYDAGFIGGEYLAKLLGGKGRVAFSYGGQEPPQEQRLKGYTDALKKYPGIEIVQVVVDEYDYSIGVRENSALLQKNPDLDAIAGLDATSGAVIARAVQELGYNKGDIHIIAFDKNQDVLELIEEGWIDVTLVQRTYTQGYLSLWLLYTYAHGKMTPEKWLEGGINPLPEEINTGILIVDKAKVKFFK